MPDADFPSFPSRKAIESLSSFGLLDALFGRRSRRFGVGMAIPDGPLAYASRQAAEPLGAAERLILTIVGAGVSGWNLGIPHTASGTADSGCNYTLRPIGRTYPSGAATHGSEILITDDSGSYLTRFRDLDASAVQEFKGGADLERLAAILGPHIVRLGDRRVEIPAEWPHVTAHNRWVANKPGSTLFAPIADQVDSMLNFLFTLTGEGCAVLDTRSGRLLGDAQQFIRAGRLQPDREIPLAVIEDRSRISTSSELAIAAYNIHLTMQGMGLGGWLYSGINVSTLLGAACDDGIPGFGFRHARSDDWLQPNPLGLDGLFEPLVPPYVPDMHEAARRFAARKFGPDGNFDPARPGPFNDNAQVKAAVERYDDDTVAYVGSVAQDIHDTYGRFPAGLPTVACTVFAQAHHIDLEFYDRFYKDGAYLPQHRDHRAVWHPQSA